MVEYEWFSYELIQYVSSDCIVLYLYAHIDYKDTWFSHELTQYVSLDFPFGKLKWFNVNLQISLCSKFFMALNTMISDFLMDWFNMSIQMSLLFSLYSQRLQVYWTFSWTDSLWVFKIPCVVALYSHRLHRYTQLLPVLIQYEASDVPVSQSCQKKTPGALAHCPPWESVSICIHDNK